MAGRVGAVMVLAAVVLLCIFLYRAGRRAQGEKRTTSP